jgi:hypothetical protein
MNHTLPEPRENPGLSHRSPKHTAPSSTGYTTVNMSNLSDDEEDWEVESRPEVVESIMEVPLGTADTIGTADQAVDNAQTVKEQQKRDMEVDVVKEEEKDTAAVKRNESEIDHSKQPEPTGLPLEESAQTAPSPSPRDSSSIGLPHIRDQAISLQHQINSLAQSLSAMTEATTTDPKLNVNPALFEESRLLFVEKEMPRLRKLNDSLRNANRRLRKEIGELKSELQLVKASAALNALPGEISRASMGIDPAAIQELAIDLATGTRKKNDIADALFALVDSSTPYPSAPEEVLREQLEPRERLRNLEGVLDVSLGRMEELENQVRVLADRQSSSSKTASQTSVSIVKGFCVTDRITVPSTVQETSCTRSNMSGLSLARDTGGSTDTGMQGSIRDLDLSRRFDGEVSGPAVWL